MAECKNCIGENVCKYKDETVSLGTTVKETIHDCKDFKDKADFVEVVRCKDCKWWHNEMDCRNMNGLYRFVPNGNWFCASGKRKERSDT